MTVLSFSLTPEATGRLTITALNLSKTAYAAFALDARTFFIDYDFSASSGAKSGDRFTCQLLNKALQSVFKGRSNEGRGRESAVERCDVSIQDQPDKTECRLIVKMLCKHGMTKFYRLTYESVEVMHALFDRTAANQGWRISSRVLREYIEFFGPKTEQLDLLAQEGKAVFTSFTEKVATGTEALKQPLETAISLHTGEFEDFHMQQDMHIVISVKDFKAIVTHAETLRAPISCHFSLPTRPLQFSYHNLGMHSEFTLMTTGDMRAASTTPNPQFVSNRGSSRQPSVIPAQATGRSASEMPPPPRPGISKPLLSQSQRTSAKAQVRQPSMTESDPDPESLFMPDGDEDPRWEPLNYEQDEGEEMLGWDANNEHPSQQTFRDSGTAARPPRRAEPSQEGLEPTQRLSQMHGMFD
ncbi:hypothetical protein B0A55_06242 [Friedmanniomyces simplex]|uniref:DNA repair protein rad9 n=1 Tax=Friedmanniomyces simplex TaxID=329884 RepID=A0A4V5NHJ6_9PEZI|nr:hypothetical protein B0A55_06242 [Friedmanniomyces simplex]